MKCTFRLRIVAKNVRITEEEMLLAGENLTNSVQLVGGDYLGIMGVFHQLHCLVRKYLGALYMKYF